MGYRVVKHPNPEWDWLSLLDPQGEEVDYGECPPFDEEEAWSNLPPLDTWEGVGLVLKWLAENGCYSFPGILDMDLDNIDDWPKAICEYALEVSE